MRRIIVINPNSTQAITNELDRSLQAMRGEAAAEIRCLTLAEGPPGIESDAQILAVEEPLLQLARSFQDEASAIVIACFSDPGLALLRRSLTCPVLGIARSGLFTARSLSEKIAVISVSEDSVRRHHRLYAELQIGDQIVADRALAMEVTDLVDNPMAEEQLRLCAESLCEAGAETIVLGCAGMSAYRSRLEKALGIPIIDPVQAAVRMALGFGE